jgi:polygalacturonase
MKKCRIFILLILISANVSAKEYNASLFGIKSNGTTNNTSSIQKAIDYINEQGGGTLVFYVGRYLTGTVQLKSNVSIRLEEGAVLVGSSSPYDYKGFPDAQAIIVAEGQSNLGISGKGVIEGSGNVLVKNTNDLLDAGYIKKIMRPALVAFSNCTNVSVSTLNLWNGAYTALALKNCKDVNIDGVSINGKNIPSSAGIFLTHCKWVTVRNMFIKVMQRPVITMNNQNVSIQNSITDTGIPLSESSS